MLDAGRQGLAYFCGREPASEAQTAGVLTVVEARKIARLPKLMLGNGRGMTCFVGGGARQLPRRSGKDICKEKKEPRFSRRGLKTGAAPGRGRVVPLWQNNAKALRLVPVWPRAGRPRD